jgi:membrane protein DedA with SNARE-associated domain
MDVCMNRHWSVTNENQFVWIFNTTGSLNSDWILYLEGTWIGTQNEALGEKPFLAAPPNLASSNKQLARYTMFDTLDLPAF